MVLLARVFLLLAAGAILAGCAGNVPFSTGEKYALEGDWDRAVGYYRQALQKDPDNVAFKTRLTKATQQAATSHLERALVYMDNKNADAALYEARQALEFSPTSDEARRVADDAARMKEIGARLLAGRNLVAAGRPADALKEFYAVLDLDPENTGAKAFVESITKQKVLDEGSEDLNLASDQPVTLSFKEAKIKEVFEFLAKLSGISILFDEDVKNSPVTVFAKDVSFTQALNLLLATNNLFMKKIASDAIIIVPKTKSKLDQYQDLMIKTFYLSNYKAKDMVNIIRTMIETRKVIINEQLNSITLRETPEKLKLIEKLIEANDRKDSEVVIDVEIMSVDRNESIKYGVNLPKGVTGTYVPPVGAVFSGASSISSTVNLANNVVTNVTNFNAGLKNSTLIKNNVWFTYPSASVDWSKTKGHAETLTNPQIRTINNKPAKILIGKRVPVQTGTVVATAGTLSSSFEYRDVGIKLTVEPDINLTNEVTLKTTLEVSSLGDNVNVGGFSQPSFNTTTAEATLSLKDGETVIIGGLLENINSTSMNGIVGVMDVPILGKIFSTNNIGPNSKRELIMTLTPHVVRSLELPGRDISGFWSGTEESYSTKPMFEEKKQKISEKPVEEPSPTVQPVTPGVAVTVSPTTPAQPTVTTPAQPAATTPTQPTATTPGPQPGTAPPPTLPMQPTGRVGLMSFAPEVTPVEVGQEVTVDVVVREVDNLYEAPLSIIYNPKLVEFVKATEGGFLKTDGKATTFSAAPNAKIGLIDVSLSRLGKVGGVTGSGTLFSLTFKGAAPGISPLVYKQNTMKDANGQTVQADMKTGTLYIK